MKERIAFVDYIRVIACLLVMIVHASEQFYNMGPVSQVVNEDNRLWVSVYDGFFYVAFQIIGSNLENVNH